MPFAVCYHFGRTTPTQEFHVGISNTPPNGLIAARTVSRTCVLHPPCNFSWSYTARLISRGWQCIILTNSQYLRDRLWVAISIVKSARIGFILSLHGTRLPGKVGTDTRTLSIQRTPGQPTSRPRVTWVLCLGFLSGDALNRLEVNP
jgi:hypothetical protein